MANQDIKQNSGEGKFLYTGMNVHLPSDLMPKGRASVLYNVEPDTTMGTIGARSGTSALFTYTGAPITSYKYTNTAGLGYSVSVKSDGSGSIYDHTNTVVGTFGAGTFTGLPCSIIHYRPPNTPYSYTYIFDSKACRRVGYGTSSALISQTGIFPPNVVPIVGKADVASHLYAPNSPYAGTSASNWQNSSSTGGSPFTASVIRRDPGGITVGQIAMASTAYLDNWVGPTCIQPLGASDYSWLQIGSTVLVNDNGLTSPPGVYFVVDDIFPQLNNDSVLGILYDSGTSGWCTIAVNARAEGLRYGRMFYMGGEISIVQSISVANDDSVSIRCYTNGIHVAGESIQYPFSFSTCNIGTFGVIIGQSITCYEVSTNLTYSASSGDEVAQFGSVCGATLQSFSFPLTNADDYIHWSVQVSNPLAVDEIQLVFSTQPVTGAVVPFSDNYWYISFSQGSFTPNLNSNETTNELALSDFQTTLLNQAEGGLNQLPSGNNQWFETMFRVSDLTQVGTADASSLANITSIGIVIFFNANVTVNWGSIWTSQLGFSIDGGFVTPNSIPIPPSHAVLDNTRQGGPDSNWNSYGYQGTPIKYRYRYRDSITGGLSNVSPESRYGIIGRRSMVFLKIMSSGLPNIYIDIERFGGTQESWRRCQTVADPGSGTVIVTDNISESSIEEAEPLELDQYVPFPTLQTPVSGTLVVVGTSCQWVSGSMFNTGWVRGTEIIIDNRPYSLYRQPVNANFIELEQGVLSLDVDSTVQFSVPEPLIAGTNLPYAAGPFDGRIFSCGDFNNPGYLYFTNSDNPETAAGNGYIEVTGPDDPLLGVAVYEGALFVFTSEAPWRVEPTPGGANPYAAYKLSGSYGLGSPLSFDFSGPVGYYLSDEGLVKFGLNGSTLISWADLRPLFPFDGHTGVPVVTVARTFYPVDMNLSPQVCYAESRVYIDYTDTNNGNMCIVYNTMTEGFYIFQYAHGSVLHYLREGVSNPPLLIAGLSTPGMFSVNNVTNDTGVSFTCQVLTPSLNQGLTRNPKNYFDYMLDYQYAAGDGSPTVQVYVNNYVLPVLSPFHLSPDSVRSQVSLDLSTGNIPVAGLNIGSLFTWLSTQPLVLFEWQPSFTVVPVPYTASPYDQSDCGTTHYKWVQGLRINIDTSNQTKQFQVYHDGVPGPTFSINSGTQNQSVFPISFNPPFKAYLVQLVPTDTVPGSVYSVDWIFNIEPDIATHYETQPNSLGLEGFGHCREFQIGYASTGAAVFSLIVDGQTYMFYTDSTGTGGSEIKRYVPLPPLKGKLWSLAYTGVGLQVYKKDCQFRMKQWASSGPYMNANVAGDDSLTSGALI